MSNTHPQPLTTAESLYYLFPTDGFKYVWSEGYSNLERYLEEMEETVRSQQVSNPDACAQLLTHIRFNVVHTDKLSLAQESSHQVILFGMSDFYAVRVDTCSSYDVLLEAIKSSAFEPIDIGDR